MYISAYVLPLTVALTAAVAEPLEGTKALPAGVSYASNYKRTAEGKLEARLDADPELYCGKDYDDCGDGFCCSSDTPCAGKLYGIPVCKDPTMTDTFLGGTMAAIPYKDPEGALSSLNSLIPQITDGTLPTDEPNSGETTGAAALVNGPTTFGNTVAIVGAIWGIAALGGAGFFLL